MVLELRQLLWELVERWGERGRKGEGGWGSYFLHIEFAFDAISEKIVQQKEGKSRLRTTTCSRLGPARVVSSTFIFGVLGLPQGQF